MVAADRFGTAITVCARRYHATVSHVPHRDRPPDFDTTLRELRRKSDVLEPPGPQHFQASFRHLTLYTSWYRTQVWSRLIAKELLTAFDPGEVFAADVARRHRGQILPPGRSQDAADLIRRFPGRPFDVVAFTSWLEQSSTPPGTEQASRVRTTSARESVRTA
jgi:thimet oligopeptidase